MADRAALLIAVETFFEAGPLVQYAAADCAELLRALPAVGYTPERCTLLAAHRTTKAVTVAPLPNAPVTRILPVMALPGTTVVRVLATAL